ncbi:MAG: methyltetrahydrofolate--corrinoid methyltransferase [Chloroflexi bacterium GWC2_73_18]|nr:MAG: methyltetrahydrofolate--corrinoid methyltransferase [Chloroflexi bacterium GWC2_73_18]
METVLASATRTVVIGPGRPFVIIGERINPTGRAALAAELGAGRFEVVRRDALAQAEAGAQALDVNAGVPGMDERALLVEMVRLVSEVTDLPLSLDSADPAALEGALEACGGKPLVNSVTGEDERLERVLPLVRRFGAAVIGMANDEAGVSMDPHDRLRVARRIVERAADHGIGADDVLIDPLVMTVGADPTAGRVALETMRLVRDELGVNLACGASNVSFGLPGRHALGAAFLPMAIGAGLTCAIANPLVPEIRLAVQAADVLMGHDVYARSWIRTHRTSS